MKSKNSIGIGIMILGAVMIFVPHLIGSLIFGAIAFAIAISSLFNIYVGLNRRNIWVSPISILLFVLAVMVFIKPSLSLKYAGYAIILNSISGFIIKRGDHIISSILLLLVGIFLVTNHAVAMNTIIVIIGLVVLLIGALMIFGSTSFIMMNTNYTTMNKSRPTKVNIEEDDAEEVDYRDVD